MNETLKRSLSGAVYAAIMWFVTFYSELSFHILFAVILVVCLYEMYKLRKGKTKTLAFLYVLFPLLLVHCIKTELVLLMFILTWTFDTFAYLVGVKFGKHKIIPTISPKKSWEGFVGGFIFTVIAAYPTKIYLIPEIELSQAIIISLFLPFTATLGDFIESHYKREAVVKDSGNFIPGHGGMLDRMDAFMITIPALYIYLSLIK
jgi:phosphatidate cytidylyltransferase